tara:strand:- start:818 stop:1882 length:1065 start_codon:yes stop_codon:yes gene_type:complete
MADITIPEFQGIRSAVPGTYDKDRRAGSGGQRYFTDMEYVTVPSFRGDRAMHDAQNYLLANPDVQAYYDTNEAALLEGGDEQYETPEGYAKWHYETVGKYTDRPTDTGTRALVDRTKDRHDLAALRYQQQNLANPAREGLPSLQRVTDSIIAEDIGAIKGADATDREKINQAVGYMNKNAVSPYRLSEVTQTPLSGIQNVMHPFYQTEVEKAQQSSGEEIASVTELLNNGHITIEQIATYFNKPVEEVRQFYREQGKRQKFNNGGLAALRGPGMYLGGSTDGMADNVPAFIDNSEPARLSDGEFVVPADVVSHLGNGNSDSGAKQLYGMMDRVRRARTGRTEQGREINPNKFLA